MPPSNLTTDGNGNLLKSPQDVVETRENVFKNKFKVTDVEASKAPLEPLPKTRSENYVLHRKKFEDVLKRMGNAKSTVPDVSPYIYYS